MQKTTGKIPSATTCELYGNRTWNQIQNRILMLGATMQKRSSKNRCWGKSWLWSTVKVIEKTQGFFWPQVVNTFFNEQMLVSSSMKCKNNKNIKTLAFSFYLFIYLFIYSLFNVDDILIKYKLKILIAVQRTCVLINVNHTKYLYLKTFYKIN